MIIILDKYVNRNKSNFCGKKAFQAEKYGGKTTKLVLHLPLAT